MSRDHHSVESIFALASDYECIEAALDELKDQGVCFHFAPLSAEEWLINLHNHITWGTIIEAGNDEMLVVAGLALCRAAVYSSVLPRELLVTCRDLAVRLLQPERRYDGE